MRGSARCLRRRPRPLGRAFAAAADLRHCWDLLRAQDYEAYCCARLTPLSLQPAVVAIRAFNVETAAIKTVVQNNAMIGKMRIQFWRDAIEDIFAGKAQSQPEPVTSLLAATLPGRGLTERHFHRILDARDRDLEVQEQPESLKDLETYADDTQSSLFYLYIELLGLDEAEKRKANRVAKNFGCAVGLATSLRALPHLVTQGVSSIPHDLAIKHELYTKTLLEGPKTDKEEEAMTAACYDVARLAHGHLDEGIALAKELAVSPRVQRSAFLFVLGTQEYLERLEQKHFDAYHPDIFNAESIGFMSKLLRASFFSPFS